MLVFVLLTFTLHGRVNAQLINVVMDYFMGGAAEQNLYIANTGSSVRFRPSLGDIILCHFFDKYAIPDGTLEHSGK